jgi:Leucine-rich repeat (LRR) protein
MRRLSDINEHLLRLTNITALTFDDRKFEDDDELKTEWFKLTSLPNLQSVQSRDYEHGIPIEPLLSLRHLTQFRHWQNDDDMTEQLLQSIRGWTNLEHCSFSQDFEFPESGPFESYHTKLTSLSLSVAGVTNKWFENLDTLKSLDYSGKSLHTNVSLKHLTALESLILAGSQIHELTSTKLTQLELFSAEEKYLERELDKLATVKELIMDLQDIEDSDTDEDDDEEEKHHSYQWLTALTALEHLNIDPMERNGLSFVSTTLTQLQIAITGYVPVDLTHVSRFVLLKEFYLNQRINVDNSDLSPISTLTQLEALRISVLGVSQPLPFAISTLSSLTWLQLSRAPAEVSHLPNLKHLQVAFSASEDFTGFVGLPNLTELEIPTNWGCKDKFPLDYTFVSRLTTLKKLVLNANYQLYNCQYLSTLTDLERLHLRELESEEDYTHLASLTKLTELKIWCGLASPKILQLPTSLQVLSIDLSENEEESDFMEKSIAEKAIKRFPNLYQWFFG